MEGAVEQLRFLLGLARELGDTWAIGRLVRDARAHAIAEAVGPYRAGVTENMVALDAALSGVELVEPLLRARAAYRAILATCYATNGRVSPELATAMARLEYASVMREAAAHSSCEVADEIEELILAIQNKSSGLVSDLEQPADSAESLQSDEEAVEAVEAIESDRKAAVEAIEADVAAKEADSKVAVEAIEADVASKEADIKVAVEADEAIEAVVAAKEAVEAVEADEADRMADVEAVVAPKEADVEADVDTRGRDKRRVREKEHDRMRRELQAAIEARRKAETERDDALVRAARCDRCDRTMHSVVRFWMSDGGKFTSESLKKVDTDVERWSAYVEKMRGCIEHLRASK
jgi:hypothetical protein